MRGVRAWMTRITGMMQNRRRDREFDQELEAHLGLHIDENIRAGMSLDDARRDARLNWGAWMQ